MKLGPRYKIAKRLGSPVFEKTQTQKFQLSLARRSKTGGKRPRSLSDYGKQLLEKQKVRYTYGVTEKQLKRYVKAALETRGVENAAELYRNLETRLDNIVYRLGFAPTRRMARQMVSHGHITVNARKVTVPSLVVKEGDVIGVREGSRSTTLGARVAERVKEHTVPSWLTLNPENLTGQSKGAPSISEETGLDFGVVMEYYSR